MLVLNRLQRETDNFNTDTVVVITISCYKDKKKQIFLLLKLLCKNKVYTVSEINSALLIFHWVSGICGGFNWMCSIKHNWLLINEYFLNIKLSNVITNKIVTSFNWLISKCPIRIFSNTSASNDEWRTPDRRTGPDDIRFSLDWFGSH